MGVSVKVELEPSFYKKVGADWKSLISEVVTKTALEAEKECKKECPVISGTLMRGHSVQTGVMEAEVCNNVNYWTYVVYGTKFQSANDYPSRVADKIVSGNVVGRIGHDVLKEHGLE